MYIEESKNVRHVKVDYKLSEAFVNEYQKWLQHFFLYLERYLITLLSFSKKKKMHQL